MKAIAYESDTDFTLPHLGETELDDNLGLVHVKSRKNFDWTEDQVIQFPAGIPGFESARRFIVLSVAQYEPFHWMECVDDIPVRFAIINPMILRPDYQPKIRKSDLESLHITNPKDLLLYVIVTLRQPLEESTANLMGPLFINIRERMGKQILIENDAYSLREPMLG